MRTVHETEALRPSDPVPKHHSSNPLNKIQRIRLVIKDGADGKGSRQLLSTSDPTPGSPTALTPADVEYESSHATFTRIDDGQPFSAGGGVDWAVHLPADVAFDADELELPPKQLYALLRRQIEWAGRDGDALRAQTERLEAERRAEWVAKELVLEDMIDRATAPPEVLEQPAAVAAARKLDEDEARIKQEDGAMELDVELDFGLKDKRRGKDKTKGKRDSDGPREENGGPPFPYLKDTEMLDAVNGGEAKDGR
jgi:hypothetical protein